MLLEFVESIGPESSVVGQPVVEFSQRRRLDVVHPPLGDSFGPYYAGLPQHPEMPRDRWPTYREPVRDRPSILGLVEENLDDLSTDGVGQCRQYLHDLYVTISLHTLSSEIYGLPCVQSYPSPRSGEWLADRDRPQSADASNHAEWTHSGPVTHPLRNRHGEGSCVDLKAQRGFHANRFPVDPDRHRGT